MAQQPFLALITPLTGEPGVPTHPIAPMPGVPTHPIAPMPGVPTHPIYWPPSDLHPEHPIVIPPDLPPGVKPPDGVLPGALEWHTVWSEELGWAVIGVPQGPHPSPSRR